MDPEANLRQQESLANIIQRAIEKDDPRLNDVIIDAASELAELVIALAEWKRKGGF